jgi:hypothetical protein
MAKRKGISTGTTAERSIEEQGHLRFNTSTNLLEYYDGTSWKSIDAPPTVSSVSPSNLLSGDGTGNYTIVVTGSGFSTSVTAALIASDGSTIITPDTVTRDSATQVTLVVAKNTANLTNANEPFDVKITNASGLAGTLASALNIDAQPVYSTAAGSLGTILNGARTGLSFTVAAADPESGGDIVYTLESGSLPAGLSLTSTSSGAVISGNADAVGSNTTSNFTIRAKDVNSNISDRAFSLTVNAPVVESFTSSGTFSVPSGITAVDVLVVAGGGSGGGSNNNAVTGGGGGAGGLIFRPAFPVTPGGTVTVTVGTGGQNYAGSDPSHPGPTHPGQDSVFGTLTAKGGGGGGSGYIPGHPDGYGGNKGQDGGSGGGTAGWGSGDTPGAPQPSGTQPTQPGDSGTYGFGNTGATGGNPATPSGSGGGSGAGGGNGGPGPSRAGGIGKAYNISGTSTYYAGGGGSGGQNAVSGNDGSPGPGGQGGGGDSGAMGESGNQGGANTGGGGGGCGASQGNVISGGNGGKGIVIVSY